ncbi:MAG: hypothetical protein WBQ60_00875 [Asticcacaulis sp.]
MSQGETTDAEDDLNGSFEARLYDLIERHQHTTTEGLEHFKSLGDDAFVVGDLGGTHQIGFYLDDIQKLLRSYGVLPPVEQKASPFWWLWPDTCLVYRDFTIGELKSLIATKTWPDDAYSFEKNTLTQKLTSLAVMLITVGLIVGIVALLGYWVIQGLKD